MKTKESYQIEIKKFMLDLGIQIVGFCSAKPFAYLRESYQIREKLGLACEFEERSCIDDLIEPRKNYKEGKSFIVILEPYEKYSYEEGKSLKGHMASGTATTDYHQKIRNKLEKLKKYIKVMYNIDGEIIVDTSPLSDRAIAVRAGLGVIRRNNMFYNSIKGSYVHIGSLLIDKDISSVDYEMISNPCGTCRICVDACPGNAILMDGTINSKKCVSYLSQKKELTEKESVTIDNMIYGCDICQRVCPENKEITYKSEEYIVNPSIDLQYILNISNKEFEETFKRTASGWRGKRTLQRNAIACLGNSNDKEAISIISSCLEDKRPIIKKEAESSMSRLLKILNNED